MQEKTKTYIASIQQKYIYFFPTGGRNFILCFELQGKNNPMDSLYIPQVSEGVQVLRH